MAASINNYLKTLSLSYYLKNDSDEVRKIDTSLSGLMANLNTELGSRIKQKFVFGSFDRDTILPRKFDAKSDIDIMVVFNHTDYERTPETYREWLKSFADKYYKNRYGSEVVNSYPTVTIRLGHIYFDLVPAKQEFTMYSSTLYIPSIFGWRTTDPNDVKQKLTESNTKYNQIVRPIVRLLKGWNCNNGYPYDSYLLELEIIKMNFYGCDVQQGFFKAVSQLNSTWNDPERKAEKIRSLKYNIEQAKKSLENNDVSGAKSWIHRILPNV